jgi:hypothetical protein
MTTFTDALGFNKNSPGYPAANMPRVHVLDIELDFAKIAAARAAAGAAALDADDVLEVLQIPAKTLVLAVGLDVTKAEGATLTMDVGDGSDVDGWLDGVNANTAASYASAVALAEGTPNTLVGYGAGKYYAAADTIDVIPKNAGIDVAVMRIWAVCVEVVVDLGSTPNPH